AAAVTARRLDRCGVVDGWMALSACFDFAVFVVLKASRAQRDGMMRFHTRTNLSAFTVCHPGAVIDKKMRADFRPGMNIDPGAAMRPFGHDARNQRHLAVKQVCHSMNGDGLERGISEYDLFITSRSWVALICGVDVCPKKSAHRWEIP